MGKKITHEEFELEVHKKFPQIKIMSKYCGTKEKIKAHCEIDGYDWDAQPYRLKSVGCPKCNTRAYAQKITKSHEQFLAELYSKRSDLELIGKYTGYDNKIELRCKKCNEINKVPARRIFNYTCNCEKKLKIERKLVSKNNPVKILGRYRNNSDNNEVQCNICDFKWITTINKLLSGQKCPVCNNKIIVSGVNDINTVANWMVKYFVNKDEAKEYGINSKKVCQFRCIFCRNLKNYRISTLYKFGFSCDVCSENVSYPNKFSRAFLLQLPIENFITEYSPKWANGRRYDNYFEYKGKKYILEMDGAFHYKDNEINGMSKETSQSIDNYKDELAYKNGIDVIRIDCLKSEFNYIKNNIIESNLSKIFDLSNIDWTLCEKHSLKNLIKEVCDYYKNISYDVSEIAKYYKLDNSTIRSYLKKGTSLKWCNYRKENSNKIRRKKVEEALMRSVYVYKENELIYVYKSQKTCVEEMNKLYPELNINKTGVSSCCRGIIKSHKGFSFSYEKYAGGVM